MKFKKIVLTMMLIFAFAFIASSFTVSAITIEQDEFNFENILQYGYAEKILKISSDRDELVTITLSATEPIKEWIKFEPESARVVKGSPAEFKIILEPFDAALGTYQGYVIINVISSGNELTTALATATDIKTTVRITDEEITQANVEEVVIKDFEVGNSLQVSILVENRGNIPVLPYFELKILDINKENILQEFESEPKTLPPSSLGLIEEEIVNNLAVGKYYAKLVIRSNGMVLREHTLPFFVAEKGKISEKEETTIKVHPVPITLGSNWIVLIGWGFIILFVVLTIRKSRKEIKKKR